MSRQIERQSDSLAHGLDTGRTREVVDALQRDAYTMCPQDFRRLVTQTAAKEDSRFGDNLRVDNRTGDIILNLGDSGQNLRIGNLRQQELSWNQNNRRDDYRDDIGRRPVVREGQHGGYYEDRPVYQDRRGYDPRYDNRGGYDPRYDPRYDNRGGYDPRYDNRRGGINGGEVIEDFLRGGVSSRVGGGDFVKGGAANVGIGIILNQLGGQRRGW